MSDRDGGALVPLTLLDFETSLFLQDGGYLRPLKDAVRRPAGVGAGDDLDVAMTVRLTA